MVLGPDDTVHLKIELPAALAAKVLAAGAFSDATWDATTRWINDVPDWREWKPSTVTNVRSARIEWPKGEALNVLVDEDHPDKTIVYLVWFET